MMNLILQTNVNIKIKQLFECNQGVFKLIFEEPLIIEGKVPFSELAMHMLVADTTKMQIKELLFYYSAEKGAYASYLSKIELRNIRGEAFTSEGLVCELIPFHNQTTHKYPENKQNLREFLNEICLKALLQLQDLSQFEKN